MSDSFDADLVARFLDEGRADEAAAARTRERWLRQVAAEEATFLGTLLDIAEQAEPVTLRTTSGRTLQGTLVGVGADHVQLLTPAGVDVYVVVGAIASVRGSPGYRRAEATGGREPGPGTLAETLIQLAGDRPRVHIMAGDDGPVSGELRAAGLDVLTVRLEAGDRPGAIVYVRLAAVTEVAVADR